MQRWHRPTLSLSAASLMSKGDVWPHHREVKVKQRCKRHQRRPVSRNYGGKCQGAPPEAQVPTVQMLPDWSWLRQLCRVLNYAARHSHGDSSKMSGTWAAVRLRQAPLSLLRTGMGTLSMRGSRHCYPGCVRTWVALLTWGSSILGELCW